MSFSTILRFVPCKNYYTRAFVPAGGDSSKIFFQFKMPFGFSMHLIHSNSISQREEQILDGNWS